MVDPRDVATAAVTILLQPLDVFNQVLASRSIEVHGPTLISFTDKAAALSEAVGYTVKLNTIPAAHWIDTLVSYGMSRHFATSFAVS